LLIATDFLGVHVAGADGSDESFPVVLSQRENNKDMATLRRPSYALKPQFNR
jgi:hypothetical protein